MHDKLVIAVETRRKCQCYQAEGHIHIVHVVQHTAKGAVGEKAGFLKSKSELKSLKENKSEL